MIFAFLFVDLFDTAGTLVGVSKKAGLMRADGSIPNLDKALLADSTATVAGSLLDILHHQLYRKYGRGSPRVVARD